MMKLILLNAVIMIHLATCTESYVPAQGESHPKNLNLQQLEENSNYVKFDFQADDPRFLDVNRMPFQVFYSVCAPEGATREQQLNSFGSYSRIDPSFGLIDCVSSCLNAISTGRSCSVEYYMESPLDERNVTKCIEGEEFCRAEEIYVPGYLISTGNSINVGIYTLSSQISPLITPTPSATVSSTATATPTKVTIPSKTPTPSPIRKPEDFILVPTAPPKEVKKVVRNIIEVGVEEALDEVEGIVGSDVRTKVKIVQDRNEVRTIIEESDDDGESLSLDTVTRPKRYCLPNRNCAVRVIVTSPKFIRKVIIEKAVQKLRNAPSFSDIFSTAQKAYQIRQKTDNKYVVTVKFKESYLTPFF